MLTSDPIYYKALKPKIDIYNTNLSSLLYSFDPHTGTATNSILPISCNVALSSNGHGSFEVQWIDENQILDTDRLTVGARVRISIGKQSSQMTRLISGIVRVPGYDRGENLKVIYRLAGPSTGIRTNERVLYLVSTADKLATGQIDFSDATRKADTLLESGLAALNSEGILSTSGLAANSDVETFIADNSIEYGEAQDFINYVEEMSGGEVVIDINDVINFRNEIRSPVGGRGFTIKNEPPRISLKDDDADDTMYLKGGNWKVDWDYNKSANYANRNYAILGSETEPPTGRVTDLQTAPVGDRNHTKETAQKFMPTHTHFLPGDIYLGWGLHIGRPAGGITLATIDSTYDANEASILSQTRAAVNSNSLALDQPRPFVWRVVGPDVSNTPNNLPVIANILQMPNEFSYPIGTNSYFQVTNTQYFFSNSGQLDSFNLDTTRYYWLLLSDDNSTLPDGSTTTGHYCEWGGRTGSPAAPIASANAGASSNTSAGSGWSVTANYNFWFALPVKRSLSMVMWDPKAFKAVSTQSSGLATDMVIPDAAAMIKNKESMYAYLSQQLYNTAKPRADFGTPIVTAPNVPIFPGDPIVISDKVLGFSTSGGQMQITYCGDLNYNWEIGNYEAPTLLSLNPVGVATGYRGH